MPSPTILPTTFPMRLLLRYHWLMEHNPETMSPSRQYLTARRMFIVEPHGVTGPSPQPNAHDSPFRVPCSSLHSKTTQFPVLGLGHTTFKACTQFPPLPYSHHSQKLFRSCHQALLAVQEVAVMVRAVRTLLGNYIPQTEPHKKALDSTKKTAGKWVSRQSLVV